MSNGNADNIFVFWHIYVSDRRIRNSYHIVKRQYDSLISSGLADKAKAIFVCYVGKGVFPCQEVVNDPRFTLRRRAFRGHELVTTASLHDWARKEAPKDACVLYLHNKGERWPPNAPAWDWAKMLEYFVIERHEEALSNLKSSFTTGPCLLRWDMDLAKGNPARMPNNPDRSRHVGVWHYSGNFFWARASYIASLPAPGGTHHGSGEFWHLRIMGEELKPGFATSMHDAPDNIDLYKHHYPRERYAKE